MKVRMALLRWLLRPTLTVTLPAVVLACWYVLVHREPLQWRDGWVGLFVVAHGCLLSSCLGKYRSGTFAFTYTRGYSRDALWGHTMLATLLAVLAVWLPVAAIIWLPIRSRFQDVVFQSPFFPLFEGAEDAVPWVWLAGYGLMMPWLHYAWIRQAQPCRGSGGGSWLAAAFVVSAITALNAGRLEDWVATVAWVAGVLLTVVLLLAGRRLHRRVEVQQ